MALKNRPAVISLLRWARRNRTAAIGAAVMLACAMLWFPLWSGERTVFAVDAASYFYPMKAALARMVQSGEWPWWNPWMRNGLPFYANPQVGLFYPPSVLFYVLPISIAFNWVIILHFALLATGFYAWLRRMGNSDIAAALGGLAIAWSGFAISMVIYLNNLQAIAWIGWTWWSWTLWLDRREPRWLALTAVGFAFQFLAGEPQIPLVTAAVALLLGWIRTNDIAAEPRKWWAIPLALGSAAVAAILLTAVQIIPTAELFLESARSSGLRPAEMLAWSLEPTQIHNLILPRYYDGAEGLFDLRRLPTPSQPWVFTSYLGMGVLLLSVAGIDRRHIQRTLLWTGLALLGVLLALGAHNPLVSPLLGMPFVRIFRYPEKMLLLPAIAVPVLAAAGLDRIRSDPGVARRVIAVGVAISLVTFMAWAFTRAGRMEEILRGLTPGSSVSSVWILEGFIRGFGHVSLFAGLTTFLLLWRRRLQPVFLGALLVIVAIADLGIVNPGAVGLAPTRLLGQSPKVLEGLPMKELRTTARIRTSPLGTMSRGWFLIRDISVASQHYFLFNTMGPNLSMVHSVLAQDGIEAFRPRSDDDQSEILQLLPPELQVRYLRLQSTKWLAHWPLDVPGLRKLAGEPVYQLDRYEIVDPLPRAYLINNVKVSPNSIDILNHFIAGGEDPHRVAYVTDGPGLMGSGERIEGGVHWLPGTNNSVQLRVQAPQRVLLVLTDTWYPGWKATINGISAPIERVNWHFRGVYLAPGEHLVKFDYTPRGIVIGGVVSILTLIVLSFVVVKGRKRGA